MEQQLTQLEPLEGEELDFRVAADSTEDAAELWEGLSRYLTLVSH
jgi:hypothetical protein